MGFSWISYRLTEIDTTTSQNWITYKGRHKELSYLEAITLISNHQLTTPFPFKSVAPFMDSLLPEEGIATIQHFMSQSPPNSTVSIFFQGLGDCFCSTRGSNCLFYRKALMNMVLFSTWDKPEGAAQGIRWVEAFVTR